METKRVPPHLQVACLRSSGLTLGRRPGASGFLLGCIYFLRFVKGCETFEHVGVGLLRFIYSNGEKV